MIQLGLKGVREIEVNRHDLASEVGNMGTEVLSTHRIVLLMELASRDVLEASLPAGKIAVGTLIAIRHFAAAPLGARVRVESILEEVHGRRLVFHVAAYDEFEKLAEGRNELVIISAEAFQKKLAAKASR